MLFGDELLQGLVSRILLRTDWYIAGYIPNSKKANACVIHYEISAPLRHMNYRIGIFICHKTKWDIFRFTQPLPSVSPLPERQTISNPVRHLKEHIVPPPERPILLAQNICRHALAGNLKIRSTKHHQGESKTYTVESTSSKLQSEQCRTI